MKTVNVTSYQKNDKSVQNYSRLLFQNIFGIENRTWWVKRLKACGLDPKVRDSIYTEKEGYLLALLDLFLKLKRGRKAFSIEQFALIREKNLLVDLVKEYNLNPIKHFNNLKEIYDKSK